MYFEFYRMYVYKYILRDIARPNCLATLIMISLDNKKHTGMISLIMLGHLLL